MPLGIARTTDIAGWQSGAGPTVYTNPYTQWTPINDTVTSTAQAKFGTASMFMPSATNAGNQGISATLGSRTFLDMGSGDFTIELFLYLPSLTAPNNYFDVLANQTTGGLGLRYGILGSGVPGMEIYAVGTAFNAFATFSWPGANQWLYMAVQRSGTTISMWSNSGSSSDPHTVTDNGIGSYNFANWDGTSAITIGQAGNTAQGVQGYIDEVLFTKGLAKYVNNSSYALPTTEYTLGPLTSQLLHMNGVNNGTSFPNTQSSAANQLPAGALALSTSINYAYQQYSQSSVAYVGPDSSNRPVFFFAYANSSNLLRAQLWRINDDGTITQGAEQSAGSQSCYHSVQAMSEYEGANSFGNGTGNYVYLSYTNFPTTLSVFQAASVNQDALTCTFGTAVVGALAADFDGGVAAYVGGTSAVFGCRTGGGFSVQRYTRSGTTLTAAGTASADQGYRIDPAQLGFQPNGTTQYRSAYFDTGNGASGTIYGATELGATNYTAYNTSITTSNQNFGCNLNSTDRMLGTYGVSGTVSAIAVPITWNAASAPTFAAGTAVTALTITPSIGGSWFPVSGFATNTAYIIYNDTATTISYLPVTVSGTTVTIGSSVQMFAGLSNFYYQMMATSAVIGTKTYLAGVQVRSSGAPYIYGVRYS